MQTRKISLFILIAFIPFAIVNCKQDSIKISLEFIAISMDIDNQSKDSTVTGIYFHISLENNSNEYLAFGSYNERNLSNQIDVGYFLLIHKNDTIKLTTGYPFTYIPNNESLGFVSYINRNNKNRKVKRIFKNLPKNGYKEYLYKYLLESEIVYIPLIKNYKRRTKGNESLSNFYFLEKPKIVQYPQKLYLSFFKDTPLEEDLGLYPKYIEDSND